ncbi:hypothetical protein AB0J38_17600 [Streptomyces sp. NPDC050095]|uniref:hypothetical protein n=1 Tax=unclassified Streptomyces TaxID=2593676 RepID=UPI00341A6EAD
MAAESPGPDQTPVAPVEVSRPVPELVLLGACGCGSGCGCGCQSGAPCQCGGCCG